MKDRVLSIIKIVLSLGLLAFVLIQVGLQETIANIRGADLRFFAAAFGLYVITLVVRAYRWRVLLKDVEIKLPFARLVILYFVGAFFNNFLPSSVGGDVVKMYEITKHSQRGANAVGTVLMDRATGLLVVLVIALVALPLGISKGIAPEIAALTVALAVGGWGGIAIFWRVDVDKWLARFNAVLPAALVNWGVYRQITAKLVELHRAITAHTLRALAKTCAVALVFNILLIGIVYLLALSLGIDLAFGYFLLYVPLVTFVQAIPISWGGLGIREGGYVYFFGQAGVGAATATSLSLLFYAVMLFSGLIGGIFYAVEGARGAWGGSET